MNRRKAIIWDDEADHEVLLHYILKKAGFDVILMASEEEIHSTVLQNVPDILIIGNCTERGRRYEICQSLRNEDLLKTLPILCLSTDENYRTRSNYKDLPGVQYLVMPTKSKKILQIVEELTTLLISGSVSDLSSDSVAI